MAKLTKAQKREITEIATSAMGWMAKNTKAEQVRVRLKLKGLTARQGEYPWRWSLTPAGQAAFAALAEENPRG